MALEKNCLVTVGATVGFEKLTKAVLQPTFWTFLSSQGFTALRVQSGPDVKWAAEMVSSQDSAIPDNFEINVFESRDNLMLEEMTLCKESKGRRERGLVIAHAGELQTPVARPASHRTT